MSTENVTWIAGSAAPVAAWNGATKSVQTYCGLEIDIIAIKPRPSWIHLGAGTAWTRTSRPPADASLTDAMPPACLIAAGTSIARNPTRCASRTHGSRSRSFHEGVASQRSSMHGFGDARHRVGDARHSVGYADARHKRNFGHGSRRTCSELVRRLRRIDQRLELRGKRF